MESKNTFHLKKKPFVQALQYVNRRKAGSPARRMPVDGKIPGTHPFTPRSFFTQTIPATKRLLILTHTQLKPVRRDNPEDE